MIRPVLVVILIMVLAGNAASVATAEPATPVVDPFGPGPEACAVAPRSAENLAALLGDNFVLASPEPAAVLATPGGEMQLGVAALPDGTPADGTAIAETARQAIACRNAGDGARYLALFTDDAIRRSRGLGVVLMLLATPEALPPAPGNLGIPLPFPGLFHARQLPDGRMAAIAPSGFMGVPELYIFARENGRWRIDDVAPLGGPSAMAGVIGNTFTGERLVTDADHGIGRYGFGIEWGPEWTAIVDLENGILPGMVALTDDVSLVVVGVPFVALETSLASCVSSELDEIGVEFQESGLALPAVDLTQDFVPAQDPQGRLLRDTNEQRAFAVYDLTAQTDLPAADAESYRLYVECRRMAGGAWLLGITHLVPTAAYETEGTKRDELLAMLEG